MSESVTYDGGEATYAEWRKAVLEKHPGKPAIVPQRFIGSPPPREEQEALRAAAAPDRLEFLERLLRCMATIGPDNFFLAAEAGGPFFSGGKSQATKVYVNCNDLFEWACADAEEVTPENVGALEQAAADVTPLFDKWWGYPRGAPEADRPPLVMKDYAAALFACRVRGQRPQGPCYQSYPPELAALFDAAGPPRGPQRPYKEMSHDHCATRANLCPRCLERRGCE